MSAKPADPQARQDRQLRRARALATGLLVLAAAGYIWTLTVAAAPEWVLWLRAAAEAGVVGGLADWFAVTALFRRPLGLPIPHTAILPNNKHRIGRGLGQFVETHFLDPAVVADRLSAARPTHRIGQWLVEDENAEKMADRMVAAVPYMAAALGEARMRKLFGQTVIDGLARLDPVPALGQILRAFLQTESYGVLLDRGVAVLQDLLARNEDRIYARVSERSRWWVPKRFDRQMAESLVAGLEEMLEELARSDGPVRRELDRSLRELAERLEHSETFRRQVADLQRRLVTDPELRRHVDVVWDVLRERLTEHARARTPALVRSLAASLEVFGRALLDDDTLGRAMDVQIGRFVEGFIVPFRATIGAFIAEVVSGWDTATVTTRLERAVGRDLQFIRVNGTVVGALAGAAIFGLTRLLGVP